MKNNIHQFFILFALLTICFSLSCGPSSVSNCIDCDADLNCTSCATTYFLYDGDTCSLCSS